jgi:hypothetical protein
MDDGVDNGQSNSSCTTGRHSRCSSSILLLGLGGGGDVAGGRRGKVVILERIGSDDLMILFLSLPSWRPFALLLLRPPRQHRLRWPCSRSLKIYCLADHTTLAIESQSQTSTGASYHHHSYPIQTRTTNLSRLCPAAFSDRPHDNNQSLHETPQPAFGLGALWTGSSESTCQERRGPPTRVAYENGQSICIASAVAR